MIKQTAILLFMMLFMGCGMIFGQNGNFAERQPLKIKVITTKGKPYRSKGKAFLYLESDRVPFLLGKDGTCMLDATPNDTVFIAFANYRGYIPVNGMDSIVLRVDKNKVYATNLANQPLIIDLGYDKVVRDRNLTAVSSLDVQNMPDVHLYNSLPDLLRGKFAGLNVSGRSGAESIRIRGMTTVNNTDPLIVLDGINTTWSNVVDMNVQDIKSISVIKDGIGYGSRGANGVIVITTKDGR